MRSGTLSALGLIATALPAFAVGPASRIISVPLDARQLSLHNVNAENIEFRKRKALKLGLTPEAEAAHSVSRPSARIAFRIGSR